jgi:hypothetical protein
MDIAAGFRWTSTVRRHPGSVSVPQKCGFIVRLALIKDQRNIVFFAHFYWALTKHTVSIFCNNSYLTCKNKYIARSEVWYFKKYRLWRLSYFILFTALAPNTGSFTYSTVAKQRHESDHRSFYELLTVYGHQASIPENEKCGRLQTVILRY